MCVLGWSIYSAESAPSLEYLLHKRYKQSFDLKNNPDLSAEEFQWGQLLDKYGFDYSDELDRVMVDGIQSGYFDDAVIIPEITRTQVRILNYKANSALAEAWQEFHGSFKDNEQDVVDKIFNGTLQNISFVSILDLNATVVLLKELGYNEKATQLLEARMPLGPDAGFFNLANYPYRAEITDPELQATFKLFLDKGTPMPTPVEAGAKIRSGGWSNNDEEVLDTLSVADFANLLTTLGGAELSDFAYGVFTLRNIGGRTDRQTAIVNRFQEAFDEVARRSWLNEIRARKYAVGVRG